MICRLLERSEYKYEITVSLFKDQHTSKESDTSTKEMVACSRLINKYSLHVYMYDVLAFALIHPL